MPQYITFSFRFEEASGGIAADSQDLQKYFMARKDW
jgi:hypothetical protein